jgi:TIR domain
MEFIDWCSTVLRILVEEGRKSTHVRSSGLDIVRLFHSLFPEGTGWNSPERKGLISALMAMEEVGIVEGTRENCPKVTMTGRDFANDLKPLWKEICSTELHDDQRQVLSIVNQLSVESGDNFARITDVDKKLLLQAMNEPIDSPLEVGSGFDLLWRVSEDLEELGLVKRRASPGFNLTLTATYSGLVWETRQDLFRKCEVFISHITEEKDTAQKLKTFLCEAFGEDLKIFVSSDYRSIGGGKLWFHEIIESLIAAPVVLVILSGKSVERRWINFEAGIGLGSGSLVIPVVSPGLSKSNVGPPLSQLQVRALFDPADVQGLIADIAGRIGRNASEVGEELAVE